MPSMFTEKNPSFVMPGPSRLPFDFCAHVASFFHTPRSRTGIPCLENSEQNGSPPTDDLNVDSVMTYRIMPRAASPLARIRQHVGPVMVFTEHLYRMIGRRAHVELFQSVFSGCHGSRLISLVRNLVRNGQTPFLRIGVTRCFC